MASKNSSIKKTQKPILAEGVWEKRAAKAVWADNVAALAALNPPVKADSLIRLNEGQATPEPALVVAARASSLGVVQWLLKNALGESIGIASIKTKTGRTPLIEAADEGCEAVLDALLPHSDARAADESGNTALTLAAIGGHDSMTLKLLPTSNAMARDNGGNTALMFAAVNTRPETIQAVLAASDAKAMNDDQQSAITMAAYWGKVDSVRILAPHSDLGARDSNGHTVFEVTMADAISGEKFMLNSAKWEIIDFLAPSQPRARIDELFAVAGAQKMPQWAALLEAETLAEELGVRLKENSAAPAPQRGAGVSARRV